MDGRLPDWVSIGVLTASVPREVVDAAVVAAGRQALRCDGKLPPRLVAYFVMALALFADDDYEEVAARLTDTLESWGWSDDSWSTPTSGGLTQARQRLGWEVVRDLFRRVAAPVAQKQTLGAFLRPWRLMGMDGFDWDTPDTTANAKAFGYAGSGENRSAFCQGASGQHQRVRLPRDGQRGAGPLYRQGQRGAGVGPQALPAPKPGLAAHCRP